KPNRPVFQLLVATGHSGRSPGHQGRSWNMPAGLQLTKQEITAMFDVADCSEKFPPILTLDQAAELLQLPKSTLYDWRSRGLLDGCSRRVGKHVRVVRDRFIQTVFNERLHPHE